MHAQSHLCQARMAEKVVTRPRFIAMQPIKRSRKITPKAHALIPACECATPTSPPPDVAAKLGKRCLVAGVDVETHDWEGYKGVKGEIGQYGFYSIFHPNDLNARIVQLGWAIGTAPDALVVKECVVQPTDFQISEKATRYHGISHEWAMQNGRPLRKVLEEFMKDIINVYDQGGRIVVHHLEFDCGVIGRELQRAELSYANVWHRVASSGMCTMDPYIGAWLRQCCGEEVWPGASKNTLRLKEIVRMIAPGSANLMAHAHTAGSNAQMHVAVYFACLKLACIDSHVNDAERSSCRAPPDGKSTVAKAAKTL